MSSSLNSNLHQAPTLPKPVQLFSVPQPSKNPKDPLLLRVPSNPLHALHLLSIQTPSLPINTSHKPPLLSSPIVSATMKPVTITLFLLLALVASAATFASEEDASESTCMREMRRHPLDKYCRSFMMRGRRGGSQGEIMMVDDEDDDDNEGAPEECCNQLRRTKEECRCPAVRHMMREIMQQEGKGSAEECRGGRCGEMMTRGRFLPAMCGMEPRTCRMRQSGTGY